MHHRIALRARANQHYVYSGRSVLVTNLDGAVTGSGTEGFYFANTRLLSRDELTADGQSLAPVAASPVSGAGFLGYAEVPASASVPQGAVYVATQRAVADGMRTVLRIENYNPHTHASLSRCISPPTSRTPTRPNRARGSKLRRSTPSGVSRAGN